MFEWVWWIGDRLGVRPDSGHACVEREGVSEEVRSHAMCPRNFGPLDDFDGNARITGACGDTMEFWVGVRRRNVRRVSFITTGCGPSLASGSMATTLAEGRSIEEAMSLRQKDILDALHGLPSESEHCALLAADTLRAACEDFLGRWKTAQGAGPLVPNRKV